MYKYMYRATPAPRAWNDLIGVVCGSSWPWRSLGRKRRRAPSPSECRCEYIVRMSRSSSRRSSSRATGPAASAPPRAPCRLASSMFAISRFILRSGVLPVRETAAQRAFSRRCRRRRRQRRRRRARRRQQLRCGPVAAIGAELAPWRSPAVAARRPAAARPPPAGSRSDGTGTPTTAGWAVAGPAEPEPEPERARAARRGSPALLAAVQGGAGAVLEVAGTDAGYAPGGFGSGTAGSGTTGRGSRDPPGGTGSGGAPSIVNDEEAEALYQVGQPLLSTPTRAAFAFAVSSPSRARAGVACVEGY